MSALHRARDAPMMPTMIDPQGTNLARISYQRIDGHQESPAWRTILWAVVLWTSCELLPVPLTIVIYKLKLFGDAEVSLVLDPRSYGMAGFYLLAAASMAALVASVTALVMRRSVQATIVTGWILFAIALGADGVLTSIAIVSENDISNMTRGGMALFSGLQSAIVPAAMLAAWPRRIDHALASWSAAVAFRIALGLMGAIALLAGALLATFGSGNAFNSWQTRIAEVWAVVGVTGGLLLIFCAIRRPSWLRGAVWVLLLLELIAVALEILGMYPWMNYSGWGRQLVAGSSVSIVFRLVQVGVIIHLADRVFASVSAARPH